MPLLTPIPVDVWSVGCILAELLGGRPLFKGRDYVDQLNQILHHLGTQDEPTISGAASPRVPTSINLLMLIYKAQAYIHNLPYMPKIPFNQTFPNANPEG